MIELLAVILICLVVSVIWLGSQVSRLADVWARPIETRMGPEWKALVQATVDQFHHNQVSMVDALDRLAAPLIKAVAGDQPASQLLARGSFPGLALRRARQMIDLVCVDCRSTHALFERPDGTLTSDISLENSVLPCQHHPSRQSVFEEAEDQ